MGRPKVNMTPAQRRRMFAMAKEIGLDLGDLREMACQWTGKRSVSSLNKSQAEKLLLRLQQHKGADQETTTGAGRLSPRQLKLIQTLYSQLDWKVAQLREWLKVYHGVDHEKWLTPQLASKVIEGLKAMIKRKEFADADQNGV